MKKLMRRISAFCLAVILGILPLFCINDVKAADDVIRLRDYMYDQMDTCLIRKKEKLFK